MMTVPFDQMDNYSYNKKRIALICDLDHTLSDAAWRQNLVPSNKDGDGAAWDKFHEASARDNPNNDVRFFLKCLLNTNIHTLIVTGRTEKFREITINWLRAYNIDFDSLYMRPDDNRQHDKDYKRDVFLRIMDEYHIWTVLEDRDAVTQMAREELGLNVWQVRKGMY